MDIDKKARDYESVFGVTATPNLRALWVAQDYANARLKVFPLRENKIPCIKGWPNRATTDDETLRYWFLESRFAEAAVMVGISCGLNGIVALDADRKHGKENGVANLYGLYAELGIDPATDLKGMPITVSPSGSEHHFFLQPSDKRIGTSRGKLPPQIDVRGDGGQVVLPGSIGATGLYIVKPGAPSLIDAYRAGTIPVIPQALVEIIGTKRERANNGPATDALLPEELVERIFAEVPNEPGGYFDDRDRWVSFGFAMFAASGGAARGEWLEWCGGWGGNPDKDAAFWDSVNPADVRSDLSRLKQALDHFGLEELLHDVKLVETRRAFGCAGEIDLEMLAEEDANRRKEAREVSAVGESAARAGDRLDPFADKGRKANARVKLVKAADVAPEKIEWLWDGYLARSKMHLLAGPSTAGKTTLSLALVASITTGRCWPDGTRCEDPGDVLIWSGEDGRADTLSPRLRTAGADISKVHFVDTIQDKEASRPFDPSKDMDALSETLATPELEGKVRLLIIDSLASAIAGDAHRNNEVRRGLQPVVDLAERHGVAVLGIVHFSKGTQGRNVMERVNGSLAFGALARILLICAVEENEEGPNRLLFLRGPSNIGPSGGGWEYSLSVESVPDHPHICCTAVRFGDAVTGSANAILAKVESADGDRRGGMVAEGIAFLKAKLKDGPVSVTDIRAHAAAEGIAWRTLERAKKELDIAAMKIGKSWSWRLVQVAERFAEANDTSQVY